MTKQKNQGSPWLPLGARVLVKPLEQAKEEYKKTNSGIILTGIAGEEEDKRAPIMGKVLEVSAFSGSTLEKGDTVLFARNGNDKIKVNGELFLMVPIENLIAKKA